MYSKLIKITLAAAIALVMLPMAANAKKPHPISNPGIPEEDVECVCVWTDNSGDCEVTWPDVIEDDYYGAEIEFNATFFDGATDIKMTANLDLDDVWSCDPGIDGTCTATGTIDLPDYDVGSGELEAEVKEKDPLNDTQDFVKTIKACNLPEDAV